MKMRSAVLRLFVVDRQTDIVNQCQLVFTVRDELLLLLSSSSLTVNTSGNSCTESTTRLIPQAWCTVQIMTAVLHSFAVTLLQVKTEVPTCKTVIFPGTPLRIQHYLRFRHALSFIKRFVCYCLRRKIIMRAVDIVQELLVRWG